MSTKRLFFIGHREASKEIYPALRHRQSRLQSNSTFAGCVPLCKYVGGNGGSDVYFHAPHDLRHSMRLHKTYFPKEILTKMRQRAILD